MPNWTREQKQAIEARGGSLLVSAAAGSGKTAVLVERVIGLITDEARPCDADRLLVVTFTNAAAAEMRSRIAARLRALSREHPEDINLRRQQLLLQHAHISTIHAFCLELLRAHFEKLDIPPDFRVADEKETEALLSDTLDELLEEEYAAADREGAFSALSEMLGAGRDDRNLTAAILRLYDFLRSLPDADAWMEEKLALYRPERPFSQNLLGRAALGFLSDALSYAADTLRNAMAAMQDDAVLQSAYAPAFSSLLAALENAGSLIAAGKWDEAYDAVRGMAFERLGSARKVEDTALKDRVKVARDAVKKQIQALGDGILCGTEADCRNDLAALGPLVKRLFAVVRKLDERFYAKKKEKELLDFNDLEHLALLLLRNENGTPTPVAKAVAGRFDEVLVDEYQDVNRAQDAIFRAVSRGGKNLFMVGDVKQSIYRFRKATPELFIEKKEQYAPYDNRTFPARIVLGANFRSRKGVADAVNFVFGRLMSRAFGGIDYGMEEQMAPAASYFEKPAGEADFAFHVLETADYDENDDNTMLEARYVARLIAGMIREKKTVQGEDGAPRAVTCRDFCVLLRSANASAQTYVDALEAEDLKAYAEIAGGYLGSYEVEVMLSLLRVLDNPLQDIPLLSVMLSPVFGFTPDDLAGLRLAYPKRPLYLALAAEARGKGGAFSDFITVLDELRRYAAVLPADRLILRVYERTGFLSICAAMPGGEARQANLRLLLDYARDYGAAGYRGLSGFVRFIDRISEDADLTPAATVSENADVVRVMSIHKSKGLEFPVCIVAGCGRRFNREDSRQNAMFHPEYGFGCYLRDGKTGARVNTLPREVVRLANERASMAEEMRVIYVAMTRAKEKLICVAALPSAEKAAVSAASLLRADGSLVPYAAVQAPNYAAWLMASLLRHPSFGELRRLAGREELAPLPAACPAAFSVAKAEGAEPVGVRSEEPLPQAEPETESELRRRLAFRYPAEDLTALPSKLAVSEVAEADLQKTFGARRPSFLQKGLSPAQKGTALHAFLQMADLSGLRTENDVQAEVQRLVSAERLLPEEGDAVAAGRVLAFLKTPLYQKIREADRIWKEMRFNLAVPPDDPDLSGAESSDARGIAAPDAERSPVVLQGMADVVFTKDGRAFILDYKTDRADSGKLRRRYARQVKLYARAVAQILNMPVSGCYLYGFYENVTVSL